MSGKCRRQARIHPLRHFPNPQQRQSSKVLLLLHLSHIHKRKYAKLAAESASDKEELRKMEKSKPQSSDVENIKSLMIDELRRLPSSDAAF